MNGFIYHGASHTNHTNHNSKESYQRFNTNQLIFIQIIIILKKASKYPIQFSY